MTKDTSEAKLHAMDYWQVLRNRYGVILLAFCLVFMTAAMITYILPREYKGKAVLEIKREPVDLEVFNMGVKPGRSYITNTFIQTQFKIISSKENLIHVIKDLKLEEEWDLTQQEAYQKLLANLRTEEERGTDLVNIEYFDHDPALAMRICNSVAQNYQDRRIQREKDRTDKALLALDSQLNKQKDKVEQARIKVMEITDRLDIVDLGAINPRTRFGEAYTGTETLLANSMMERHKAEANIESLRDQIKTLSGLSGDQLIESAAGLDLNDPVINSLYPELKKMEIQEGSFAHEGVGVRHPKYLALQDQMAKMKVELQRATETVKKTLGVKLEMAENSFRAMQNLEDKTKGDTISEKKNLAEYTEAKKDWELQKEMLMQMETKAKIEGVDKMMPKTPIEVHEWAEMNPNPAKPNVPLNLILGAVVGLGFGMGLAFFLEYLDTSVKTLEDVERYLQVPVLAVIPKDVGVLHKQSGLTPDAEAYRILRTNIEFNRKSADANSITVVSGGAGEGKSTTLVNLAYICAQGGYNTLMIDGDLRRPKLHTFFDINNSVGLTNYLTTELMLEDVILQTPVDNLYFMPSGILPADAAGILNSRRMSELIADVKNRFDLVLIDSPPILGVSDAAVLASEVDLTMIVIQHRKLPRSMLLRVKQSIENVGGNLLGVVLNNVDVRSDSQYQYYTSYYTYYSPTNTQTRRQRKESAELGVKPGSEGKRRSTAVEEDEY